MKIAEPLAIDKYRGFLRFRSLLNQRVFSLALFGDWFQFVELDRRFNKPFILKFLYTGKDAEKAMKVIEKEVCDV